MTRRNLIKGGAVMLAFYFSGLGRIAPVSDNTIHFMYEEYEKDGIPNYMLGAKRGKRCIWGKLTERPDDKTKRIMWDFLEQDIKEWELAES